MNGVAFITANDRGHADAALVKRFRRAQTKRERTAVFAAVVRQHRDAVLCSCTERLWPDADAAVAAASDVLITARLTMADPAKLPRPDRLHGWLLAVADQACVMPGLAARIAEINWEAVRAADVPEVPYSPARTASLRKWLTHIVATLPEPRQRMYDLFAARGLDSRNAALELGTTVAEVQRLRRENRQAILSAFEVTALADAEMALDLLGNGAPGCGELRHILADAHHEGDPQADVRRLTVVLPTAARLTLSRHLSECGTCQDRRDDCMARWAPELLPILADAELYEQVMDDLQSVLERGQPGAAPGIRGRVASVGTAGTAVNRRPAVAAAGAGLLVALLLLAFVWPGFLHASGSSAALSSQDQSSSTASGIGIPQAISTSDAVPGNNQGGSVRPTGTGLLSSLPPVATPSSGAVPPSVYYTIQPSTAPTSSPAQPTSEPEPTSSRAKPSPSSSSPKPKSTPSSAPSTKASTTPAPTTPAPTPSVSTSTPTPTPTVSTSTPDPTPSVSDSTPAPTDSATDPSPSSAPASPTDSPSTAAPSPSATS
jgi:hypothetical protein